MQEKEQRPEVPKDGETAAGGSLPPAGTTDPEAYRAVADKVYPGITMFARDTELSPEQAAKYTPGLIIREKAFTDASIRFTGMVTSHRYVILSNHMRDMSVPGKEDGTGLFTAKRDARFKVLGSVTHEGKTGIFLLHLPEDESWKLYRRAAFSVDRKLYEKAAERFIARCGEPPAPELSTRAWLDRCAFPLGMSDSGRLWPTEDKAPWEKPDEDDPVPARYYRLAEKVLLKHTAEDRYFFLDPFDHKWHENDGIKAEFQWGGTLQYTEIGMEDSYETAGRDEDRIELLIGRSPACDIQFEDRTVSRRHAVIYYNGERWMVRDLQSANGTRLNGKPVLHTGLELNDVLEIGGGTIVFLGESIRIREKDRAAYRSLPGRDRRDELYPEWRFHFLEE